MPGPSSPIDKSPLVSHTSHKKSKHDVITLVAEQSQVPTASSRSPTVSSVDTDMAFVRQRKERGE